MSHLFVINFLFCSFILFFLLSLLLSSCFVTCVSQQNANERASSQKAVTSALESSAQIKADMEAERQRVAKEVEARGEEQAGAMKALEAKILEQAARQQEMESKQQEMECKMQKEVDDLMAQLEEKENAAPAAIVAELEARIQEQTEKKAEKVKQCTSLMKKFRESKVNEDAQKKLVFDLKKANKKITDDFEEYKNER